MNSEPRFRDRHEAGQLLAKALQHYAGRADAIVLALPRGGVPVGYEVARALNIPLDVMVVRKLGFPIWKELAMGAVATGGVRVLNEEAIRHANISPEQVRTAIVRETRELHRREIAYRGSSKAPEATGKTVLLVDDGMATGFTVLAAVEAIKSQRPAGIVIAVPVASAEGARTARLKVDEVVALGIPEPFVAVAQWYQDFGQVSDREVTRLLSQGRRFGVQHGQGNIPQPAIN